MTGYRFDATFSFLYPIRPYKFIKAYVLFQTNWSIQLSSRYILIDKSMSKY